MAFLAQCFKQETVHNVRADVDLVIRTIEGPDDGVAAPKPKRATLAAAAPKGAACDPLQLTSFPAHNIALDTSEYFRVQQGACWKDAAEPDANAKARDGSSFSGSSSSSSAAHAKRPVVRLTIDRAEQLPAAEAVIAAMYGVPDAISSLEQQQMLLQSIVEQAPCCRNSSAGLAAVLAADVGGKIQQLLVAAYGDLQAVWSDAQQQAMLLALPLPAMQLLLSSDQLCVPSEDTVLYTAKKYVQAQKTTAKAAAAKAALAPLVRAPQLSMFALSCAALPASSGQQLLSIYALKLVSLQSLKRIAFTGELAAALEAMEGAPASWLLRPRQIKPLVDGVRLQWRLPVEQLQQACRDSFAQQQVVHIYSPDSPPLGAVAWRMLVECEQQEGGTVVGLFVGPVEVPAGIYYKFETTLSWQDSKHTFSSPCLNSDGHGYNDFFDMKPMAGDGWDAAAWAAAGLPTAGEMLLEVFVHSVQ
uniref:BACK domain-containing protein n=1 Tax=Tetradesmus obliquus TaxID=3088 RepID=A0A383VZ76_TETOB|eukprot:jgi/Sobl393_1/15147/SZX70220.1